MKPIKGFENYLIDEYGNIYNAKRNFKKRVLGLHTNGYSSVVLCKNNQKSQFVVHRLVYQTFIGDLKAGMEINHIDGDKQNNHYKNLEQITHKENMGHYSKQYRNENPKLPKPPRTGKRKHGVPVLQIQNGEVVNEFRNLNTAARSINKPATAICYCANGERKSAYGYQWKYKEEAA